MIEYIKAHLRYEDGFLYRITNRGGQRVGDKAGWLTYCNKRPYWKVIINRKMAYVHQVVFLMRHGYLPDYIDHVDGDSTNNRIENLRPATQSQNIVNSRLKKNNTSGYKGVTYRKDTGKWRAAIMVNGKHISLGSYFTKEEAYEAYKAGAQKHFGEFARPESRIEHRITI